MKKEYIIIKNNVVIDHAISDFLPSNSIEVKDFCGYVGLEIKYLSSDFQRLLTLDELISKKIVNDNRGIYYNKQTLEKKEITELNIEISDEYTKEIPQSYFDEWSDSEQKFITNQTKKKEHLISLLRTKYNDNFNEKILKGFNYSGYILPLSIEWEKRFSDIQKMYNEYLNDDIIIDTVDNKSFIITKHNIDSIIYKMNEYKLNELLKCQANKRSLNDKTIEELEVLLGDNNA